MFTARQFFVPRHPVISAKLRIPALADVTHVRAGSPHVVARAYHVLRQGHVLFIKSHRPGQAYLHSGIPHAPHHATVLSGIPTIPLHVAVHVKVLLDQGKLRGQI